MNEGRSPSDCHMICKIYSRLTEYVSRGGSTSNMAENDANKQLSLAAEFHNWHCRLGHLSSGKICIMARIGLFPGGLISAKRLCYVLVANLVRSYGIHGGGYQLTNWNLLHRRNSSSQREKI